MVETEDKWEIRAIFSGGHPMLSLADHVSEAWEYAAGWHRDGRYRPIVIVSPNGRLYLYPDAPPPC